jgi:hypothetical protein
MPNRIILLVLGSVLVFRAHAAAQRAPVPPLRLVEEWRADARKLRLEQTGQISIAPDGRVIVAPGFGRGNGMRVGRGDVSRSGRGELAALDSAGKTVLWRLATGWGRDMEIAWVDRIGWTGTQMWVGDRGFRQIALVDNTGKVTRSIENPPFARPSLSERRKYPIFADVDPLARYADGSLLVRPLREKNVFDTPEFDSTATHLLRVSADGIIAASVASYPPDAAVPSPAGRGMAIAVPLQNRTLWNVSPDGMRIVLIATSMSGRDSATFGVVTLNERGDTVFTRRLPFTPVRLSPQARDSAVTQRVNAPASGDDQVRAALIKRMPPFLPPVTSAFIGRDRTTWIVLRPSAGDTTSQPLLVLDPRGDVIGGLRVRRDVAVLAADRDHAWTVERDGAAGVAIVRYRVVR